MTSEEILMPGLMRSVFSSRRSSGWVLIIAISTIRSREVSVPVASISKKMRGRLSFIYLPREAPRRWFYAFGETRPESRPPALPRHPPGRGEAYTLSRGPQEIREVLPFGYPRREY